MKSLFISTVACLFFVTQIHSQFAIRPYFGINSTQLTKDYANADWQSEIGYQVGVDAQFGNKVYVQPGIQWELLNKSLRPTNPTLGDATKFNSTHIRIPLLLGFRLLDATKSNLVNLRVYTGPDISFLISAEKGSFGSISFDRESLKSASYGYNVGAGVDIMFLFLDAGYKWGLTRFFEESLNNNGSKANVFFVNAGLKFKI